MKICAKCKIEKSDSDFGLRTVPKANGTYALKSYCKICSKEAARKFRVDNNYSITANEKAYRSEFYKKPKQVERIKKYNNQYHADPDKKVIINANRREYSKTPAGIISRLKKALKTAKTETTKQRLAEQMNELLLKLADEKRKGDPM